MLKHCSACGFEFDARYARYARIGFPTVGIPISGKTLWAMTAYDQINKSLVPRGVRLHMLPSPSNEGFDQLADLFSEIRNTPPTGTDLPKPLIFYHCDRGRFLGLYRSEVLLTIFDFGGEAVVNPAYRGLLDRALQLNGFLVFVDPTSTNYTAQIVEMRRFLSDLRRYRDLPENQAIDVPVAVCISKIDLLVNHSMGESARAWVAELRATADRPMDLRTIRYRSESCERVLDLMFPGANLRTVLRQNLGSHMMFFPLSSIGIAEDLGLGSSTLPIPFGVLEPILWLLHMNGYSVLE
jgi:hypothetical protein